MGKLAAVLFVIASCCTALPLRAQTGATADDKIFADKAMAAGMAEIDQAKVALDKSGNDHVRKFAERLIQDHAAVKDELSSIARSEGLGLPTLPTEPDRMETARLRRLPGNDFDRTYLGDQVAAHKAAVALFLQETKTGQDPALLHFAERALPILNDHLQMAQSLAAAR